MMDDATIPLGTTIGILGGGQLGRMLSVAASRLGFRTVIFDPAPHCPASHTAAGHICAAYEDTDALTRFAAMADVVTYEFENIPTAALDTGAGPVPDPPRAGGPGHIARPSGGERVSNEPWPAHRPLRGGGQH